MRKVLFSTFAIALLIGTSFAQEKMKGASVVDTPKQWLTEFPAFMTELVALVGPNPGRPIEGKFGVMTAKDDKGNAIWLIPQSVPECPEIAAVQRMFSGNRVSWNLKVEKIEDSIVYFEKPDLTSYATTINQWFGINAAGVDPKKLKKITAGQVVRISGDIGVNLFEGIYFAFGVGSNEGKIALGISLRNARIEP